MGWKTTLQKVKDGHWVLPRTKTMRCDAHLFLSESLLFGDDGGGVEEAVVAANLTEPEVSEALAVLRGAATLDASLRARLESLAARFDDEYFRLDEDGGQKQQALVCFSKARAMSALVFALADDDTQRREAIYESISALDEPAELLRLVKHALG